MQDWTGEIEAARERIAAHVRRTPVMQAVLGGHDVALKFEHVQHTGSFKPRGAFNTLLSREVPEAGADLVVVPGAYANALEAAEAYEAETGAMQVHAYDSVQTVAGQGTVMAEWEAQGLEADTVLIAVGGGGLIAGALGWLAGRRKVVAVEPRLSCALHAALQQGAPVDVDVSGVAANALGARRIGEICLELAQARNVESLLVEDDQITAARTLIWRELRQAVEPAGATAMAALLCGAYRPEKGERVAVLLCGANAAGFDGLM